MERVCKHTCILLYKFSFAILYLETIALLSKSLRLPSFTLYTAKSVPEPLFAACITGTTVLLFICQKGYNSQKNVTRKGTLKSMQKPWKTESVVRSLPL